MKHRALKHRSVAFCLLFSTLHSKPTVGMGPTIRSVQLWSATNWESNTRPGFHLSTAKRMSTNLQSDLTLDSHWPTCFHIPWRRERELEGLLIQQPSHGGDDRLLARLVFLRKRAEGKGGAKCYGLVDNNQSPCLPYRRGHPFNIQRL